MTDILKNEDLYKFDARTKVILCYKYAFYTISTGILMYLNKVLRGDIRFRTYKLCTFCTNKYNIVYILTLKNKSTSSFSE